MVRWELYVSFITETRLRQTHAGLITPTQDHLCILLANGGIAPLFSVFSFQRDQCILSHGEQSSSVYFLTAGKIRATLYSPDGKAVSYQELLPGEMLGELSAIDNLPRSTHVIGLSDGECLVITGGEFFELVTRYPVITQAVLLKMAGLVRSLCDRLYEFATLSVVERLQAELLRLGAADGKPPRQAGGD